MSIALAEEYFKNTAKYINAIYATGDRERTGHHNYCVAVFLDNYRLASRACDLDNLRHRRNIDKYILCELIRSDHPEELYMIDQNEIWKNREQWLNS